MPFLWDIVYLARVLPGFVALSNTEEPFKLAALPEVAFGGAIDESEVGIIARRR